MLISLLAKILKFSYSTKYSHRIDLSIFNTHNNKKKNHIYRINTALPIPIFKNAHFIYLFFIFKNSLKKKVNS